LGKRRASRIIFKENDEHNAIPSQGRKKDLDEKASRNLFRRKRKNAAEGKEFIISLVRAERRGEKRGEGVPARNPREVQNSREEGSKLKFLKGGKRKTFFVSNTQKENILR